MEDITTIFELMDEVNNKMNELVENLPSVEGDKLGLDRRAGYNLMVNVDDKQIIVKENDDRSLMYYGGFEYIDEEHKSKLGGYVIYSVETNFGEICQRLAECFGHFTGDFSDVEGYDDEDEE